MGRYDPGAECRGTCPYCERRCRVHIPHGGVPGGRRVCDWHRSPDRAVAFGAERVCPGSGQVCLEDRTHAT